MQVALAWLLHRSPNILLIPGTSSIAHLRENLAATDLSLSDETLAQLQSVGESTGTAGRLDAGGQPLESGLRGGYAVGWRRRHPNAPRTPIPPRNIRPPPGSGTGVAVTKPP